jgi:tRNA A-37 threonylcarbamoyl transferase component Bud32
VTDWVWHVTPAGRALFGDRPPPLAGEVVKQNLQRTVRRATVGGVAVFVKACRPNTPRGWLRDLVRGPKARLEFAAAARLGKLGIPCVEPLAWGRPAGFLPAESVLVTRAAAGEPLAERFGRELSPADRRDLADRLACLMLDLHAAGVTHPDPHPGNFLVHDAEPLRLLDLHDLRFGRPLTEPEVVRNLVLLNRFFQLRATRTDRRRFWHMYRVAGGHDGTSRRSGELARLIEGQTCESNRRFWAARVKRHLGDNRDTRRVRGPAARGWAARDLPPDLLATWLADPDAPFRTGAVVKDSRTSTVARVDTPVGPVAYKRFNCKSWLLPLKALGRRPPAVRSWLAGHALRDRDLPTARPLACFQRRRLGLPTAGYLVCEWLPDAEELRDGRCADELGRTLRRMHDRAVRHRDLKAANVLVQVGRPVFIDLVGVTAGPPVPDAERVRNLARLARSFVGSARVRNADRLRLLRAYLGPTHHNRWKEWWRSVASVVRQRL